MKKLILTFSHLATALLGFAVGIYALPILIAPQAPSVAEVESVSKSAQYKGEFRRNLKDSDTFHWGEGTVHIGKDVISLQGNLAPGPDYKLYLSPEFVETEADFNRLKSNMLRVGDVTTFENFIVPVSNEVNVEEFNTVVVWCESFGQFITSASYAK